MKGDITKAMLLRKFKKGVYIRVVDRRSGNTIVDGFVYEANTAEWTHDKGILLNLDDGFDMHVIEVDK